MRPSEFVYHYFVFSGKKLHLELNNATLPSVCKFFNLNYNEI